MSGHNAPMTAVGLAGFGSAGRGIHAPLLQQAGMTIAAVATADPQRVEQVRRDVPDARVVTGLDALLGMAGLDLIVLATPSGLHAGQARQCIDAGIAVVVDKPLATDARQALEVVEAARAAGVALTVFQNRRFDAEHVAARETVRSGRLGEVFRHEFRWERWRPTSKDRWRENASAADGGGILLDLHSHMIDAAVDLFGPIETVYAEVAARTTPAEDDAFLACRHTSGWCRTWVRRPSPRRPDRGCGSWDAPVRSCSTSSRTMAPTSIPTSPTPTLGSAGGSTRGSSAHP